MAQCKEITKTSQGLKNPFPKTEKDFEYFHLYSNMRELLHLIQKIKIGENCQGCICLHENIQRNILWCSWQTLCDRKDIHLIWSQIKSCETEMQYLSSYQCTANPINITLQIQEEFNKLEERMLIISKKNL